jgi:hypothetical protein
MRSDAARCNERPSHEGIRRSRPDHDGDSRDRNWVMTMTEGKTRGEARRHAVEWSYSTTSMSKASSHEQTKES